MPGEAAETTSRIGPLAGSTRRAGLTDSRPYRGGHARWLIRSYPTVRRARARRSCRVCGPARCPSHSPRPRRPSSPRPLAPHHAQTRVTTRSSRAPTRAPLDRRPHDRAHARRLPLRRAGQHRARRLGPAARRSCGRGALRRGGGGDHRPGPWGGVRDEIFGVRWPSGVYVAAGLAYEDEAHGVQVWEPSVLPERRDDRWTACFYAEPWDPSLRPTRDCPLCTEGELLAFVRECESAATV
jgi:hypothetical protein